jgi:hypothetical protein
MMKRSCIALLLVVGCGPAVAVDAGGTTMGGDDGEGESAPDPSVDPDPSTTLTTGDPTFVTEDGDESSSPADDGSGFIERRDHGGDGHLQCDIWVDDCPLGQKCTPVADDGGSSWNAWMCMPLAEDPKAVGEGCTVENSGVSGIDDCEKGSMCWDVDPDTLVGECVAFCSGSEANPTCEDPCTHCAINGDGILIICLPACDPLLQDCYEGGACYPENETFSCSPDAGGDMGALGEPCEFINVCDPGLFCASPESAPSCGGPTGCCASFCDALAEDPCAAMPAGVECIPFFAEGEGPPCFSGVVGGCLLPE